MRLVRDALVSALALFTLGNLVLGLIDPALDANWLWLGWGGWTARIALALFVLAVLTRPWQTRPLRAAARIIVGTVGLACLADVVGYYQAVQARTITVTVALPLSLLTGMLLLSWVVWPPRKGRPLVRATLIALGVGVWITALVGSIATTDYARHADAIFVYGAAVRPDGTPSQALYDRTRTACELYRRGLAPTLVFSGGKTPGIPISEPEAMRRQALAAGVNADDIVLDEQGVNTRASVENAAALAQQHGWRSLLMVSHDYHLARVKLAAHRAGLTVYTVPAVESYTLIGKPYFFARELAAWAWYWVYPPSL